MAGYARSTSSTCEHRTRQEDFHRRSSHESGPRKSRPQTAIRRGILVGNESSNGISNGVGNSVGNRVGNEVGKLAEARAWLVSALADGQPHSAGELQMQAQ